MPNCCGLDHYTGEYTPQQRADLDRVLAFNRRLAAAVDDCRDGAAIESIIDPDPLRYMWVDEGGGRIAEFLRRADHMLDNAPVLEGHRRGEGRPVCSSGSASRPSVATARDGRLLYTWLEWEKDAGDRVLAQLVDSDPSTTSPATLVSEPSDCFRPTAVFDASGVPWVFYARATGREVSVHCRRFVDGSWCAEELVSTTGQPSFNQEVVAHVDGSVEVCWQGPTGKRFGIFSRRWQDGVWSEPRLVSEGTDGNVWDPSIAAAPGGGTVYAWCEYTGGSYRIVVRRAQADGRLSGSRPITSGSDYALHPSLAVTSDGATWCAFDLITVGGHGGSGPTRLRPIESLPGPPSRHGTREGGEFWPPELMPEITAAIKVLRVDDDGVRVPAGDLAPDLDVVPSGLPRLVADPAGGLTVAYRVHRRMPLATYYWEVAVQTLGPDGWSPPTTYRESDGTLEEPSVAPSATGAVVVWQTDARLERALTWTEGFGGRECPYLLEHHGEVIWHGMHGTGSLMSASVVSSGPARVTAGSSYFESSEREEVRSWAQVPSERYRATVDGKDFAVYWGDLHRHSLISRCTAGDEPSLEDFYRYSWDVCEYDFWAVTDHSENSTDYQWWSIQKMADLFLVDGRFVPLYGFEWTGFTGHQNVIYGDVERGAPIFSAYASETATPRQLWDHLASKSLPAVTIPHHPGSAMVPFDWDYYDPEFMRLVEVFQACRGNYEADGCFRQYSDGTLPGTFVVDGLHHGHRYGLIASSDHGYGASYIGAFAESLDRKAIFSAMHARRVFAATQRDIVVDFRVNGTFMGGETFMDGPVEVEAFVRGYGDLARIEIVRNGDVVHVVAPDLALPAGWQAVGVRVEWGLAAETTDWSGMVTIDGGEILLAPYWGPEITDVSPQHVAWSAVTRTFGEPYGSQRGGVEFTVLGPSDAQLLLKTAQGTAAATIADLATTGVDVPLHGEGRLRLQQGVGGLASLGGHECRINWLDESQEPGWYYLRAYQTDGEMAWSSPVWVDARPEQSDSSQPPDVPAVT